MMPRLTPLRLSIEVFCAFAGLFFIALCVSQLSAFLPNLQERFNAVLPASPTAWAGLVFFCLCTGFLEEGIFRRILPRWLEKKGLGAAAAIGISTVLFGYFHLWEGRFGVLNALISGIFLASRLQHHDSIGALALAHALYNFTAYLIAAFQATTV